MKASKVDKKTYYRGVAMVPYDLLKEVTIAMIGVLAFVLILSAVLSSPDVPSVTLQSWSKANPVDFLTTASGELAGSTTVASYGPPYNSGSGSVQNWGPLDLQQWAGVHVPINAPYDFVLEPLTQTTAGDADLVTALSLYKSASASQQQKWLANYTTGLGTATVAADGTVSVPTGDYGPVSLLMDRMLTLARSGGLDALLLTSDHFYQTDFSRALLFLDDGGYIADLATQQKLDGDDWGVMNETGRYPGQAWLWLYTMWYQIPPFNSDTGFLGISSANTDLAVVGVMLLLTALLLLVPFIPGLARHPAVDPDSQADLAPALRGDAASGGHGSPKDRLEGGCKPPDTTRARPDGAGPRTTWRETRRVRRAFSMREAGALRAPSISHPCPPRAFPAPRSQRPRRQRRALTASAPSPAKGGKRPPLTAVSALARASCSRVSSSSSQCSR